MDHGLRACGYHLGRGKKESALSSTRLGLSAALALTLGGCTSIPQGRSAVDDVMIRGGPALDTDDVAERLATAPSEKFLGLFRGVVYDYEIFDPTVLQRDLARVERFYRGKGFLEVHARAGRVEETSPGHVHVEIIVDEGPPTMNREVRIDGLEPLPLPLGLLVRSAAIGALPKGTRFDEDAYKGAKDAVKRALTEHGYAYATIDSAATIDPGARAADYVFTVHAGPVAKFGKISIVGLDPDAQGPKPQEIDEAPLRRAINIDEGTPYSTAEIESATQALLDLEVFSAVEIEPQLPQPPPAEPVVPLLVRVEPTRLRRLRLGFGAEFDELKTDVHLLGGWEDHNFLGGLRDLSIDFRPGLVLYPLRISNPILPPQTPLPEERLKVQFRQPSFLEAHTSGFVKPEFNIYPFLVAPNAQVGVPVLGYREFKGSTGVDRPFGHLSVSLAYNAQVEVPFSYVGPLNPNLSTIILSYPQLVTTLDFRDDPIHPHEGIYLSNNLQIAGGIFGGSAQDVRVQPEARAYAPISRRVTLATRASVGFLFAANYPHDPNQTFDHELNTLPAASGTELAADVRDLQIVYFRGFYSGGPSSNRGYPLRGIAPYGAVPFLLPQTATQQVRCDPNNLAACTLPIAGFTLWEWSTELRFQISGPFSGAVFCDMGDVSPQQAQIRIAYPHLSCGFGARYDTPVGPIRFDVGYRIPGLQIIGQPSEAAAAKLDPSNGLPPQFLGQPLAFAFGIGEAY